MNEETTEIEKEYAKKYKDDYQEQIKFAEKQLECHNTLSDAREIGLITTEEMFKQFDKFKQKYMSDKLKQVKYEQNDSNSTGYYNGGW